MPTTSPNMGLVIPVPTSDTGPGYATDVSNALTTIDGHQHTGAPNGGLQLVSASLNINADLSWNSNNLTNARSVRFTSQNTVLNGIGDLSSVYVKSGDLYYNNASGVAVQVTSGSAVNIASANTTWAPLAVSTNWTIVASDPYVYYQVDTGATRSGTLPLAAAVASGRYYVIDDVTNQAAANNITINRAGSDTIDGATSFVISSNSGGVMLVSDGVSRWSAKSRWNGSKNVAAIGFLATAAHGLDVASAGSLVLGGVTATSVNIGCNTSVTSIQLGVSATSCTTRIAGAVQLDSLTASQALVLDGMNKMASLAYATAGTASALVQRDGSGGATFAGTLTAAAVTLSGTLSAVAINASGTVNMTTLTASQAVVTDASKNLTSLAYAIAATASALVQRDGSGGATFAATLTTAAIAPSGNITWAGATVGPTIGQVSTSTGSGTGATMTIQAQNETGTTSTGGQLNLTSGTGTTTHGEIHLQVGGVDAFKINGASTIGTMVFGNLRFDSSLASAAIGFTAVAGTGVTAGVQLSLIGQQGQNVSSGTNNNGGNLVVASGAAGTGGAGGSSGTLTLRTGGSSGTVRMTADGTGIAFYAAGTVAQASRSTNMPLTAASGSASSTISDVGASFSQTTLNYNFKSLDTILNSLELAIHNLGLTA